MLNPRQPLLLTTLRRAPRSTGRVSLVGTLAALVGSALVGGMAAWVTGMGWAPALDASPGKLWWRLLGRSGGFAGRFPLGYPQAIYFARLSKRRKSTRSTPVGKTASARAGVVEQ